ncbi:MAG: hypothetical protein NC089_04575 [Bacteroides sp.]|nr:hypothetical protein [Bacteroides sp.]MCM1548669.1 hypothetical protein [Clostridium sp.]
MIKRKTKLLLESKVNDLKINLENNYKDLAQDALKELQRVLEECRESGELKDKDYRKYKQIADGYAMRMMNYHH